MLRESGRLVGGVVLRERHAQLEQAVPLVARQLGLVQEVLALRARNVKECEPVVNEIIIPHLRHQLRKKAAHLVVDPEVEHVLGLLIGQGGCGGRGECEEWSTCKCVNARNVNGFM